MRRGLIIALVLACMAGTASAQDKTDKVSVGIAISIAQAPLYVAQARGYLAAEHIAVQDINFRGAQDTVSALATGELDVSMGALNAGTYNAANQNLDIRAVASLGIQPLPVTATPLIARKDLWDSGAIRSGKDLKGRKVAVNTPGASPEYFLSLILQKYGMTIKDVDETFIGFPEMPIALSNKAVDAAIPAEPNATVAIKQGWAHLVDPEGGAGGGDMTTVFFFSGKFMRERPEVAERFLRALIRGARDAIGYQAKPDIIAILAKETKLTPELVRECYPYGWDPDLDITKYEASIRRQETQHMKDGRLTYTQPLAMDRLVDASLVHKAAASLK